MDGGEKTLLESFEQAVEDYSDMVTGLCLLRLGSRQDAEDCYQNVFLKLFIAIPPNTARLTSMIK